MSIGKALEPQKMPLFNVVLYEPDIPHNTGVVGRLCLATGSLLHLIEPLGFRLTDAGLRRAGLDYWQYVQLRRHVNFDSFLRHETPARLLLFSTHGVRPHWEIDFRRGDYLLFGSETRGLPVDLRQRYAETCFRIPMRTGWVRSLNLATAVSIVLYEGLRQLVSSGGVADGDLK